MRKKLVKVLTGSSKLRGWRWWLYRSRQILASPDSLKATILVRLKFYLRKILEIHLGRQGLRRFYLEVSLQPLESGCSLRWERVSTLHPLLCDSLLL